MERAYTAETIHFRSQLAPGEAGVWNRVTPEAAGWEHLGAEARRLKAGESFSAQTRDNEVVLVMLGGRVKVASTRGAWESLGGRTNVFDGLPHALWLPRRTDFEVTALTETAELAWAWAATDRDGAARLVTPDESQIEIRGGDHATRQINSIVPPGFGNHRLVACEVYTPGGNWSSYPPHKHDVHREGPGGQVQEADLEELYFFQQRRPEGFAVQRVYSDDGRLDATVSARHGDFVLVPYGYHPVSAPVGYDCYYLNFLAGSAQSLAASDDPEYAWVKGSYRGKDPRVPLVPRRAQ